MGLKGMTSIYAWTLFPANGRNGLTPTQPPPKSATRGKFGINNNSPTREASYGSRHWSIAQKVYLCFPAETFIKYPDNKYIHEIL